MIQSGRASLVVLSTDTEPAAISAMLALTPTRVEHQGTVARSGRVRENHVWALDVDSLDNTGADQTGTRALRALLMRSDPAFGRVVNLPQIAMPGSGGQWTQTRPRAGSFSQWI
jgi:hypothetical protein